MREDWEPRSWQHTYPAADGIVDLKTAEIGPHEPAAMNLHCGDVPFAPGATHPEWA